MSSLHIFEYLLGTQQPIFKIKSKLSINYPPNIEKKISMFNSHPKKMHEIPSNDPKSHSGTKTTCIRTPPITVYEKHLKRKAIAQDHDYSSPSSRQASKQVSSHPHTKEVFMKY